VKLSELLLYQLHILAFSFSKLFCTEKERARLDECIRIWNSRSAKKEYLIFFLTSESDTQCQFNIRWDNRLNTDINKPSVYNRSKRKNRLISITENSCFFSHYYYIWEASRININKTQSRMMDDRAYVLSRMRCNIFIYLTEQSLQRLHYKAMRVNTPCIDQCIPLPVECCTGDLFGRYTNSISLLAGTCQTRKRLVIREIIKSVLRMTFFCSLDSCYPLKSPK
jgi:hypothetical protein